MAASLETDQRAVTCTHMSSENHRTFVAAVNGRCGVGGAAAVVVGVHPMGRSKCTLPLPLPATTPSHHIHPQKETAVWFPW